MITEELVNRLVVATKEAKEAVREAHEARRDLRVAIKEADDRLGKVREEATLAVEELSVSLVKEGFERVDFEQVSATLKRTLDQWLALLGEAQDVLSSLQKRERRLADPIAAAVMASRSR